MLTDTQLTGLRLALDNAGTLGVEVKPWRKESYVEHQESPALYDLWVRRDMGPVLLDKQATPEHYDAMCARYARKLMERGRVVTPTLHNTDGVRGWCVIHLAEFGYAPRINCPDDELTALVHALAAAEGKEVVG